MSEPGVNVLRRCEDGDGAGDHIPNIKEERMDQDYKDQHSGTSQSEQTVLIPDTVSIKQEVIDEDYIDYESGTLSLDEQRDTVSDSSQLVQTSSDQASETRDHLYTDIKQEHTEEVFQDYGLSDGVESLRTTPSTSADAVSDSSQLVQTSSDQASETRDHLYTDIKQEHTEEAFQDYGLSDGVECLRTTPSTSAEVMSSSNDPPDRDCQSKTSADPVCEDVKQYLEIKQEPILDDYQQEDLSHQRESLKTSGVTQLGSNDIPRINVCMDSHAEKCGSESVEQRNQIQSSSRDQNSSLGGIDPWAPYWNRMSRTVAIAQLSRLMKNHRTEQEISRCISCEQGFLSKATLFQHLRIHSDEKCPRYFECNETFYPRSHFRRHMRREGKKYCFTCSQGQIDDGYTGTDVKMGLYPCPICKRQFRGRMALRKHMRSHTIERPHRCSFCGRECRSKRDLTLHERTHTKPYQCAHCGRTFSRMQNLKDHIAAVHLGIRRYQCQQCGAGFMKKEALLRHTGRCTHGKGWKCATCNIKYESEIAYRVHMKVHSKVKKYDCAVCNQAFLYKTSLDKHMRKHGKPHKCSECGKEFLHERNYEIHMRKHSGKKLVCPECNKEFLFERNYEIHVRKHSGKKLVCPECNKEFLLERNYEVHMRKHTGQKLVCSECNKEFLYERNLEIHMRKHTGEKPYKCSKCSKAFMFEGNLQKHEKKHTDPKPYNCRQCDKGFYFRNDLTKHERKHSVPKPYQCSYCPKGFNLKRELMNHTKSKHPEEEPFQCSECHQGFATANSLGSHMKTHEGSIAHVCPKCNKKYPSKFALSVHLKRHIGVKSHKCPHCMRIFPYTCRRSLIRHIRNKHDGKRLHKCSRCDQRFLTKFELTRHEKSHTPEHPSDFSE